MTLPPANSDPGFPAYTHIPGITAHPFRDPQGHSFGQESPVCEAPDWATLPECLLFRRGCELFNAGYYWEAHEVWEGVWNAAGRVGLVADFVKGLIKLAAAGVKIREGSSAGAHRHLNRAEELFLLTRAKVQESHSAGCDLTPLLAMVRSLRIQLPASPDAADGKPVVLFSKIELCADADRL